MRLAEIQAAESKLMLNTYSRNPYLFVAGHDVYLRDDAGNEYLDLLSGIGVSALGYRHPAIEKAIREQSSRLLHTSNLFFHEGKAPSVIVQCIRTIRFSRSGDDGVAVQVLEVQVLEAGCRRAFETRSGRPMAGYPRCLPHRYFLRRASGQ